MWQSDDILQHKMPFQIKDSALAIHAAINSAIGYNVENYEIQFVNVPETIIACNKIIQCWDLFNRKVFLLN